jgi:hypothetical protein
MLFLTFLSITNWPMALFRVAGCPCACGNSLFLLGTSTKAQSSGQNGHDHDRLYKFQSISPPFVASCTARVRSHGQQRFCQVLWMYGRRCCLNREFQISSRALASWCLELFGVTLQSQRTCPRPPVRTVRSRPRYASVRTRGSRLRRFCLRSWYREYR